MDKRDAYLEWIKDYTKNDFKDGLPKIINVVIDELIEADLASGDVSSESLGDYSVSYKTTDHGYSKKTLDKLKPYMNTRMVYFV